jgi:hypothetical protein
MIGRCENGNNRGLFLIIRRLVSADFYEKENSSLEPLI